MHLLTAGDNYVHHADLFRLCAMLPAASVDMILCDLPYGTLTGSLAWDNIIPFDLMWMHFKRVIKPRAAIVLTASQPFTSALVMSNPRWFRCEWIIRKPAGTGYLNANRQPMKNHEVALVFAEGEHNYYPQMRKGKAYRATSGAVGGFVRDKTVGGYVTVNEGKRYPLTVIDTDWQTERLHPTEKPTDVFEYFIRTYSKPGDLILDPCVGSGTTAIAARNTQRRFICGDKEWDYVQIARRRLAEPYSLPMFAESAS